MKILNKLLTFLRGKKEESAYSSPSNITQSNSEISIASITSTIDHTKIQQQQVQDVRFFTRANDLVAEFQGEATRVFSSNLSSWEDKHWNYELPYKGYMILGLSQGDVRAKIERINKGDVEGMMTIGKFNERFGPTYDIEDDSTKWIPLEINGIGGEEYMKQATEPTRSNTYIMESNPTNEMLEVFNIKKEDYLVPKEEFIEPDLESNDNFDEPVK